MLKCRHHLGSAINGWPLATCRLTRSPCPSAMPSAGTPEMPLQYMLALSSRQNRRRRRAHAGFHGRAKALAAYQVKPKPAAVETTHSNTALWLLLRTLAPHFVSWHGVLAAFSSSQPCGMRAFKRESWRRHHWRAPAACGGV